MRDDPGGGGNAPVLSGADLLQSVPGIEKVAEVEAR